MDWKRTYENAQLMGKFMSVRQIVFKSHEGMWGRWIVWSGGSRMSISTGVQSLNMLKESQVRTKKNLDF
jgi:hypothetical protein